MCMQSEWLPMAWNWCRGFQGELEGWVFSLNLSLPLSLFLSLCHAHIGRQQQENALTETHKYTQLLDNIPCKTCTHMYTQPALSHKSPCMHMHTEPGWLRSYAEEILSGTVPWLPVFPDEYKPQAQYSPMGRKPVITNARSGVITL